MLSNVTRITYQVSQHGGGDVWKAKYDEINLNCWYQHMNYWYQQFNINAPGHLQPSWWCRAVIVNQGTLNSSMNITIAGIMSYFVECVSKIKLILAVILYVIYGAVCLQFTHFPYDDCENIYTWSCSHHQIGSMNYNPYPLFRVRSWNNGMRCMSFFILMRQMEKYYLCQMDIVVKLMNWQYWMYF